MEHAFGYEYKDLQFRKQNNMEIIIDNGFYLMRPMPVERRRVITMI